MAEGRQRTAPLRAGVGRGCWRGRRAPAAPTWWPFWQVSPVLRVRLLDALNLTIERRAESGAWTKSATVSTGGRWRSRRRSDGADSPTRRTCPSTIGAGRTTWGLGRDPPVPRLTPKQRDEPGHTSTTARSTRRSGRRATTSRIGGVRARRHQRSAARDGARTLGIGARRYVSPEHWGCWCRVRAEARDDRHGGKWEEEIPAPSG